jgi:hypothetical protein
MAVAGPLTDAVGARWMWGAAAAAYGVAALLAVILSRGLALAEADPRAEPVAASSI